MASRAAYAAVNSVVSSCFSCSDVFTGGLQLKPEQTIAVVLPALSAGNSGTVAASEGGRFCATAWLNLNLITDLPISLEETACEYSWAAISSSPTITICEWGYE